MEKKSVDTTYPRIRDAKSIESILCLAVLIATGELPDTASIEDTDNYSDKIACWDCPVKDKCLACIINE